MCLVTVAKVLQTVPIATAESQTASDVTVFIKLRDIRARDTVTALRIIFLNIYLNQFV